MANGGETFVRLSRFAPELAGRHPRLMAMLGGGAAMPELGARIGVFRDALSRDVPYRDRAAAVDGAVTFADALAAHPDFGAGADLPAVLPVLREFGGTVPELRDAAMQLLADGLHALAMSDSIDEEHLEALWRVVLSPDEVSHDLRIVLNDGIPFPPIDFDRVDFDRFPFGDPENGSPDIDWIPRPRSLEELMARANELFQRTCGAGVKQAMLRVGHQLAQDAKLDEWRSLHPATVWAPTHEITSIDPGVGCAGTEVTIRSNAKAFEDVQPAEVFVMFPAHGKGCNIAHVNSWSAGAVVAVAPVNLGVGPVGFVRVPRPPDELTSDETFESTVAAAAAEIDACMGAAGSVFVEKLGSLNPTFAPLPCPPEVNGVNIFRGGRPVIRSFTISTDGAPGDALEIHSGALVTLAWEVDNATAVVVVPTGNDGWPNELPPLHDSSVPLAGSSNVGPIYGTYGWDGFYELRATNACAISSDPETARVKVRMHGRTVRTVPQLKVGVWNCHGGEDDDTADLSQLATPLRGMHVALLQELFRFERGGVRIAQPNIIAATAGFTSVVIGERFGDDVDAILSRLPLSDVRITPLNRRSTVGLFFSMGFKAFSRPGPRILIEATVEIPDVGSVRLAGTRWTNDGETGFNGAGDRLQESLHCLSLLSEYAHLPTIFGGDVNESPVTRYAEAPSPSPVGAALGGDSTATVSGELVGGLVMQETFGAGVLNVLGEFSDAMASIWRGEEIIDYLLYRNAPDRSFRVSFAEYPDTAATDPSDHALLTATFEFTSIQHVVYRGTNDRIHELWWNRDTGWQVGALASTPGAPVAAGDPAGCVLGQSQLVVYRGTDDRIHELWWNPDTGWQVGTLASTAGAPLAAGDPAGYVLGQTQHVVYRGTDNRIHELWRRANVSMAASQAVDWQVGALASTPGAPLAAGDPAAYVLGQHQHVVYRGTDDRVHELWWSPDAGWQVGALASTPGAPFAAGDPSGYEQ